MFLEYYKTSPYYVCSKCKSTYRFNLKHISNENEEKYEVKEGYVEVSEYVYMEK